MQSLQLFKTHLIGPSSCLRRGEEEREDQGAASWIAYHFQRLFSFGAKFGPRDDGGGILLCWREVEGNSDSHSTAH